MWKIFKDSVELMNGRSRLIAAAVLILQAKQGDCLNMHLLVREYYCIMVSA